ncbi:MAG: MBL fold metallo-hydrolase, partial [Pseudomonadota bacterium]
MSALAAAGALALALVFAQSQFDGVTIRTTELADGVYMLEGAGGNMAVSVGPDGVILIDDQFAPLSERIQAAIGELSDLQVRFVLNTHWHGDHTGGNEAFGATGAVIVAHDNVRERMSVDQFNDLLGRETKAGDPAALPVVTFTDQVTFHLNGRPVEVVHVPAAHTDGDSIVRFVGSNVVHAGDVFFSGRF